MERITTHSAVTSPKQARLYICPRCRVSYTHDAAYPHAVFQCPARLLTKKRSESEK